jgi:cell division transport system permease protein
MSLKLDYVSRETVSNLRRNLLLTTASMLTVGVSLAMVGMAFFIRYGVESATKGWTNKIEFEVFVKTDATPEQQQAIETALETNPQVSDVTFVDRETQWRLFREWAADDPEFLNAVHKDDLPESYRVSPQVKNAEVIQGIVDTVEKRAGVYDVVFARDEVKKALRTSSALQKGMFVIATILSLASSLLIFNTIRMAIFARRREIEVMKLVGATNWFIRVPFMVEGLVQGLLGAATAFAALYGLRTFLRHWIVDNLEQFRGFFVGQTDVLVIGGLVVVVGALVGAVSAGVAVTRFLDV